MKAHQMIAATYSRAAMALAQQPNDNWCMLRAVLESVRTVPKDQPALVHSVVGILHMLLGRPLSDQSSSWKYNIYDKLQSTSILNYAAINCEVLLLEFQKQKARETI